MKRIFDYFKELFVTGFAIILSIILLPLGYLFLHIAKRAHENKFQRLYKECCPTGEPTTEEELQNWLNSHPVPKIPDSDVEECEKPIN